MSHKCLVEIRKRLTTAGALKLFDYAAERAVLGAAAVAYRTDRGAQRDLMLL